MTERQRGLWILIGALYGCAGVGLGAFGAHGLESVVAAEDGLAWWRTGVLYQLVHAPLIVLAATLPLRRSLAPWCLLAGGVLFSGTLYTMALGGPRWLGAVTPLGGLLLMAGWLILALHGRELLRRRRVTSTAIEEPAAS